MKRRLPRAEIRHKFTQQNDRSILIQTTSGNDVCFAISVSTAERICRALDIYKAIQRCEIEAREERRGK